MTEVRAVGHRVDALTLAYRVRWDASFVAELEARATVARKNGRARFEWRVRVPEARARAGVTNMSEIGGDVMLVPPPWSSESYAYEKIARAEAAVVVGELGYSESRSRFHLTCEGFYRLLVCKKGPGAVEVERPDGEVEETEPGFTLEIIWYAERLAEWGLARILRESRALAWSFGDVFEERMRRIDLCADIAGWEILPEDADCILKRSRASKRIASDATELDDCGVPRKPKRLGDAAGPTSHEAGPVGRRRICGISVGSGGDLMSRIYNKRIELAYDQRGERRAAEEDRWRENGWDGEAPVTRVEFQIRGEAIKELGLRNPDACLESVLARGVKGLRAVDQRVAHDGDGCVMGLIETLPRLWQTLLDWVRIVLPVKERIEIAPGPDGRKRYRYRYADDPRWALLRTIDFGAPSSRPLKRCRLRSVASEAQALGVALSQAARAGELDDAEEWSEVPTAYGEDAAEVLRRRVERICRDQASRIVADLIHRFDNPAAAAAHVAVRARAKLARHHEWKGVADAISVCAMAGRSGPRLHLRGSRRARVESRIPVTSGEAFAE